MFSKIKNFLLRIISLFSIWAIISLVVGVAFVFIMIAVAAFNGNGCQSSTGPCQLTTSLDTIMGYTSTDIAIGTIGAIIMLVLYRYFFSKKENQRVLYGLGIPASFILMYLALS